MRERKFVTRLRKGQPVLFDRQIYLWRKRGKAKGACAPKPKAKKAPVVFSLPMKNIFNSDEET